MDFPFAFEKAQDYCPLGFLKAHVLTLCFDSSRNSRFGPLACASYLSPDLDTTNVPLHGSGVPTAHFPPVWRASPAAQNVRRKTAVTPDL